jgi:hypothetical protein
MYLIVCTDDSMVYGDRPDLEQAELRAKHLANKNVGRTYIAVKAVKAFKCEYENINLVEQDYK